MTSDSDTPIRLEKSQVKPASEVLARAFANDPELIRFVTEPLRRAELLRSMFRMVLFHAILNGEVYAVSPRLEGIAIWLPSGAPDISFWTMLRSGGLTLLFRGGWEFMQKMKQDEDFAGELRRRLAPDPHWYLAVLGVDPKFQGKGYASRLLKPMLARLEEEKIPGYLETTVEEYVSMYQHFGFEVIKEAVLPGSGTKMWVMLRGKGA
jgi:ribosomal protein S18 acetylase RimI-like enzyme